MTHCIYKNRKNKRKYNSCIQTVKIGEKTKCPIVDMVEVVLTRDQGTLVFGQRMDTVEVDMVEVVILQVQEVVSGTVEMMNTIMGFKMVDNRTMKLKVKPNWENYRKYYMLLEWCSKQNWFLEPGTNFVPGDDARARNKYPDDIVTNFNWNSTWDLEDLDEPATWDTDIEEGRKFVKKLCNVRIHPNVKHQIVKFMDRIGVLPTEISKFNDNDSPWKVHKNDTIDLYIL